LTDRGADRSVARLAGRKLFHKASIQDIEFNRDGDRRNTDNSDFPQVS
jgi:hypothetical protein